jgi:hypothetical protein
MESLGGRSIRLIVWGRGWDFCPNAAPLRVLRWGAGELLGGMKLLLIRNSE